MRHFVLVAVVLLAACGRPARAEDGPVPPPVPPVVDAPEVQPPAPPSPSAGQPDVIVEEPPAAPVGPVGPTAPVPPVPPPVPTPATPRAEATPPLTTAVVDIRKTHNLPWRCNCMGVRLDVDFLLVGQKDRFVGARVDFYAQNGQPIQSVLYPFANERGQLSAWTHLVRQTQDVARMHTALMIPYRAFPCACSGDHYLVTARVLLLRREGRAQNSELARGETTFTVWSGPEEMPAEAPGVTGSEPAGTGGEPDRYEEYRPQTPIGEWPDATGAEVNEEWKESTRELPERATSELGTASGRSSVIGSGAGPAPMPQPTPSSSPMPEPTPSR